jgi:coenzyme PQQ precursor peptide PqqA
LVDRRNSIGPYRSTLPIRQAQTLPNAWRPTGGMVMAWTTPMLVEICIGLEINGYLPAEF